ncbi:predicted protein [Nematostella vectensis]|uniref:C2H2-type domain-containing protein n=1 Tax=Nematostella vectensis TaxID=45351 RepID=A7SYS4_NEMVE|nr:predicted protein [Nematostella vectensis]|eukprot:XP_001623241.1 predicted protein [Nematostella vectensis]
MAASGKLRVSIVFSSSLRLVPVRDPAQRNKSSPSPKITDYPDLHGNLDWDTIIICGSVLCICSVLLLMLAMIHPEEQRTQQCHNYHIPDITSKNSKLPETVIYDRRAVDSIKRELNEFADWIQSYVPEPVKKTVDKRVKRLKEKIKRISEGTEGRFTPKEQRTALKGYLKTHGIAGQEGYDPKTFIANIKPKVLELIDQQKKPIKVKFIFTCRFIKEDPATGQIDEELGYFHTEKPETVTESADFSSLFDTMANYLLELVEQFQKKGSGWQFDQVEYFDINIDPFEPLSGSSYIPLPSKLATKHAVINVRNGDDHECFKWAVTSAVYPREKDPQRLNERMIENSEKFDWSGIEFPVSLKQIDKFEKQNPYTVNVFGYETKVYPLRISEKDPDNAINLLLISNDETNHYCWIKNMMRLVSTQIDKFHHTRFLCCRCLNSFRCKQSLEKHSECCGNHEAVRIEMPNIDKDGNLPHIKFKKYNRKMRVPFVVYADFESFTENIDTCSPDGSKSFTKQYQKHKPSGFCYLIKCFDGDISPSELVRYTAESPDEDIPQLFVESLESDIKKIYDKFRFPKKVKMTPEDGIAYNDATHCHICEGELGEDKCSIGAFDKSLCAMVPSLASLDGNPLLFHNLRYLSHKFCHRVDNHRMRPFKFSGVYLFKPFSNSTRILGSQCFCIFISRGNINHDQRVTVGFSAYVIVGHKQQIGLVNLIRFIHSPMRSGDILWSWEIDLPQRLFFKPLLSLGFTDFSDTS